jgi:murein DD-endopeptidase MepM/ murein hydrolase activator NlpD
MHVLTPRSRRLRAIPPALVLFFVFPKFLPAQEAPSLSSTFLIFKPRIEYDAEALPGALLRVRAWSMGGIDALSPILVDRNGKPVSRGVGFHLDPVSETSEWVGLVGIPSTLPKGEYTLIMDASRQGRKYWEADAVAVGEKKFATEAIPLNQSLTALRAAPDPRKNEEARALFALLESSHSDAVFEWGLFIRPVEPLRKSAGFGDRREYLYSDSRREYSIHNGIDYALPEGSPVLACGRGRVVMACPRIMTGNTVVVEHLPGFYSLYFHLSEIIVGVGDVLSKGQILGKVGMTGLATGPHLHWEVEVLGVAVDPEAFLRRPILDKGPDLGSNSGTSGNEGR